jgi:glycosyltransferase involved in cell wall biosynthesis
MEELTCPLNLWRKGGPISNAKVALQLSTREGFEVKVSEALHKGIPVVTTKAGGIPLQVEHGKNGYLVDPGGQ